ncbi:GH25 family lysozyme [Lysinibacillus sp. Bpr_S20]|uniref:GH25 family lysozyme n=1 Tax=Lysinibacillus sp. Bpr_S20 TaxID=2933964 RepID=UPI002012F0BE|nr:GH25 family lysozyme [Lysinibacillus sp. Bpr_S20]MCL1701640.1 glycoside hydrolase family 25 [Lysinibacillus sp. Bpr_S20]
MGKIIDISHHQGDIDWSKASKEVDLAIIRTQYGTSTIDRKYVRNISDCKKFKIPFGVYIYVTFTNKSTALAQAKDFYNRAQGYNPLFYVVDVEESFGANAKNIQEGTQAFIDYLKGKGVKVGLYTGHHFYEPYGMNKITNYDFLWIPRYSTTSAPGLKPKYPCDLWQFTEKGTVAGIKGNVDLNMINGSKPLSWFTNNKNEEELSMSQYTELKNENKKMKEELVEIKELLGGKANLKSESAVAATHKDAWNWAIEEKIIKGDGISTNPSGALTRQQMATMLKRYHDKCFK